MTFWPTVFRFLSPVRKLARRALLAFLRATESGTPTLFDVYFAHRLAGRSEPTPTEWPGWEADVDAGRLDFKALRQRIAPVAGAGSSLQRLELDGYVMLIDADDPALGRAHTYTPDIEPHVSAQFRRYVRPDSTVLDIGANMGWYTLLAAKLAPRGRVIAVEAHPGNVRLIEQSLAINTFDNVEIWPVAASDRPGLLAFATFNSNGFVPKEMDVNAPGVKRVPAVALDALLEQVDRLDLVKIDIEGFEPYALRGMRAALQKWRPVVLCEFHPWILRVREPDLGDQYLRFWRELGYRLGILTLDAGVLEDCSDEQIWAHWRDANVKQGFTDGEFHLDLIALPNPTSSTQPG